MHHGLLRQMMRQWRGQKNPRNCGDKKPGQVLVNLLAFDNLSIGCHLEVQFITAHTDTDMPALYQFVEQ